MKFRCDTKLRRCQEQKKQKDNLDGLPATRPSILGGFKRKDISRIDYSNYNKKGYSLQNCSELQKNNV